MTDDDLTGRLLSEVFPGTHVGDPAYLRWLYRDSPFGAVVETNLDDDLGRSAHYAVVPCTLDTPSGPVRAALSLNTAVHERARGGGVFTRIADETFAQASARGVRAVIGVANANSTPGFVRRLGFTLLGPLPATVLLPRPGRGGPAVHAAPADVDALSGDADLAAILGTGDAGGVHRTWTASTLAWRLRAPQARYAVHRAPGIVAISTSERRQGISVAILLALFADHDLERGETAAVVRSACRVHRAPVALHVGLNRRADLHGPPLPERLRPSPLNLIFRWLDETQLAAPQLDRFEFLDFDAY